MIFIRLMNNLQRTKDEQTKEEMVTPACFLIFSYIKNYIFISLFIKKCGRHDL